MISVIILAFNEEAEIGRVIRDIQDLPSQNGHEIIVVDGGSTDATVSIAQGPAKVLVTAKGKARQMNEGANIANGDILFFVHADMYFPENALLAIEAHIYQEEMDAGAFANEFDQHNKKIKRLGIWLNFRWFDRREQSDRHIFYGDNGIFVKRGVFKALGGFKEIPIMEDYDFSIRLRARYKVNIIRAPKIIVSARRHQKAGFLKTRLQWIFIKKLYLLGVPPAWLARWYRDIR